MTQITRRTQVVSISLPPKIAKILDEARKKKGQTRSSFIAKLVEKEAEDERWKRLLELGRRTARKFNITSEDDIDRILHEDS